MIKIEVKEEILTLLKQENPANPLEYLRDLSRDYCIEKLNNHILNCRDCDICDTKLKSMCYGNSNAPLMVIGDYVLPSQLELGKTSVNPFEGTVESTLINNVLDSLNINKEEIFWMNTVNCCPYKKSKDEFFYRAPTSLEAKSCRVFLDYALDIVKPLVVILMGNIALNSFFNETIIKSHGKVLQHSNISMVPVYNPKMIYDLEQDERNAELVENYVDDFCNDIEIAMKIIQEKCPNSRIFK